MLKPIHHVPCSPALRACRRLQEHLLTWLCDPAVDVGDVTKANLQPPRVPTQIEADWLWNFLLKVDSGRTLLSRAQVITGMSPADKLAMLTWGQAVAVLSTQFQPNPPAWPQGKPAIPSDSWLAFKELMEAFYEKGLRSGLPYAVNGTPVNNGGVNYADFVQAFRDTHRLNPAPGAREVCVLCGGPLGQTPEVDHWIAKSTFPLLSVCADNLLPICGECNSTSNKGEKPVHMGGAFTDWFHPYLRHANGAIQLRYNLQTLSISASATNPADSPKVTNLDSLLNLASRWTREFKSEYIKQQGELIKREQLRKKQGLPSFTQPEIHVHIQTKQAVLLSTEPHHEVHSALFSAMLDQARLASWQVELELL